jgi:hypothetical protein
MGRVAVLKLHDCSRLMEIVLIISERKNDLGLAG